MHKLILIIYISISFQIFNLYSSYNSPLSENVLKLDDFDDIFGDINVIKPSFCEKVRIGQVYQIIWNSKGGIDLVTIGLFKDYEFIEHIVLVATNNGSFMWYVGYYEKSASYSIGIWDYNDFNCGDLSDLFIIISEESDIQKILSIIGFLTSLSALILLIYFSLIIFKKNDKFKSKLLEPQI